MCVTPSVGQAVWADVFGEDFPSSVSSAADMFLRAGDSVLLRLYSHVEADGFHLYEQLDRSEQRLDLFSYVLNEFSQDHWRANERN